MLVRFKTLEYGDIYLDPAAIYGVSIRRTIRDKGTEKEEDLGLMCVVSSSMGSITIAGEEYVEEIVKKINELKSQNVMQMSQDLMHCFTDYF